MGFALGIFWEGLAPPSPASPSQLWRLDNRPHRRTLFDMANPPTVGTADFLFDAATILSNAGYEFVILAKPANSPLVHYTAGLESKETAESMVDTMLACVADRFHTDSEEDDEEPA